jgi:hypothetical protein
MFKILKRFRAKLILWRNDHCLTCGTKKHGYCAVCAIERRNVRNLKVQKAKEVLGFK